MRSNPTNARARRLALPSLVLAAGLVLGACGSDDDSDSGGTVAPVETVASDDTVAPADTTAANDDPLPTSPAATGLTACDLLTPAEVDALIGTSGATGSTDTTLGLMGCRFATARTDVTALLIGYGETMAFEDAKRLACDGADVVPVPAVGPEAVDCFGAVVAPAGAGTIIASLEDPVDGIAEDAEQGVIAGAITTALATLAAAG